MPKRLTLMLAITAVNIGVVWVVLANLPGRSSNPAPNPNPKTPIVEVANNSNDPTTPVAAAVTPAGAPGTEDEFKSRVAPFLTKYCVGCHGPEKQKADLTLHGYTDKLSVLRGRKIWLNVAKMVHEGEMPSGKGAKPTQEEREWLVKWIDSTLNAIDCSKRDPGRVTIRRLNRVEYNNTVRDLLGVNFSPADDFPSDDVGYGFDNIGDVLSLPPVLLEKYLKAAEQVVTAALAADPSRKGNEVRYIEARELQGGADDKRTKLLMSNGDIFTEMTLPKDGKYEFRVRAYGHQAGSEPVKMALVAGNDVLTTFDVKAVENQAEDYKHTADLKKGKVRIAARFTNDFMDEKAADPKKRDRNLLVRSLTVIGPILDRPELVSPSQIFTRFANPDGSDWRETATEILARKARQAYRRPVKKEEVERLVRFVETVRSDGGAFEQGIGLALQAMLVSPHFLFRIEIDPQPLNPDVIRSLTDHELATRLSYFLWSSMPDDELLSLADKGLLRKPEVLEKQIKSMLQDRRATALVKNFAGQWLQLRSLERVTPDRKNFPDFDQELRMSMWRETELFFETIVKEDRSILEFLDGRFTFVNGRLARHYGIPNITGDSFKRIDLDGSQRSGILTHASILTITSNPTRTSPVLRGKYVLEEILGTPPPPAPPDVPELPEGEKGELVGSLRQRMEQHRANAVCASCHEKMDPIGFGLENYDGIGKWRTMDGKHPVDPTGIMPTGESFKTPAELKRMLMDRKKQFARNLAEKMLTYALGRGLEYYDKCAVDDLVKALEYNEYRFSSLIAAIAQSDPFTKRRGKRADEP